MKYPVEVRCLVCHLVFCCSECRWKHEKATHNLLFDCPICRGNRFLCKPDELNNNFFLEHLSEEHLPLQCKKCNKIFKKMDDLLNIDKCESISELLDKEHSDPKLVNAKFDSIFEKVHNETNKFEAIVSVDKASKTAIITPIVRKNHLVDYESSDSDEEVAAVEITPEAKLPPKTPKFKKQRSATPHVKKLLNMMRQRAIEEYEEIVGQDENSNGSPLTKTTPSRNEQDAVSDKDKEMTTPTSHLTHLVKLAQIVTTSTPTHPATSGWSLFSGQEADSPLSEIENAESPGQSTVNEASKIDSGNIPKLKSIIVTGSRIRLGSQDSSEKQVTIQDSVTDASSVKTKKVKFAEDTVFKQEPKVMRVFRKPKRMLTPGPQKPRYVCNPRFQALINRFETQGLTMARTPINSNKQAPDSTPPIGEHSNMPARAINFKEDSPVVEENYSKESNELFKTCVDSPIETRVINNAITALSTNIASSVQNCLTSVLKTSEEETEIQFKFVITKKKVSVKRIVEDGEGVDEKCSEVERLSGGNKENIWSTVAKAVRNVFWGEQVNHSDPTTPHSSFNSTSSSASKRKCCDMTDPELSPLNHKRHKYEGRIQGRPPLRSKTWVSSLRSSRSAEQSILKSAFDQEDVMNQSF